MSVEKPDLNKALDQSKFEVKNADQSQQQLTQLGGKVAGIKQDFSGTNQALSGLDAAAGRLKDRATQGNTTADYWAQREQQQGNELGSDPASLGKAMMLRARQASLQAAQSSEAGLKQQQQFAAQAQQLQMSAYQTRMQMAQSQMQLAAQKSQILNSVQQTRNGLNLAQLQLQNMYYNSLAQAKNGLQAIDIGNKQMDISRMFGYINMGIGAAASGLAAGAAAAGPVSSTGVPTGGLTAQDAVYANQLATQGYVGGK